MFSDLMVIQCEENFFSKPDVLDVFYNQDNCFQRVGNVIGICNNIQHVSTTKFKVEIAMVKKL